MNMCKPSIIALLGVLAGCASTQVMLAPSPQAPVCEPASTALVLWAPQWRTNQKDAPQRELAAQTGLRNFLAHSGCFARSELRRIPDLRKTTISIHAAEATSQYKRVLVVGVLELGPVIRLLSSPALVEGGTEVVLQIQEYAGSEVAQVREFTVHYQNGGPGVVKGVAGLPDDMQATLAAGLQPGNVAR